VFVARGPPSVAPRLCQDAIFQEVSGKSFLILFLTSFGTDLLQMNNTVDIYSVVAAFT